jgi:hypothetical protein
VAHIFRKDRRQFYSLERLWGDAEITEIEDEVMIPLPKKAAKRKKKESLN